MAKDTTTEQQPNDKPTILQAMSIERKQTNLRQSFFAKRIRVPGKGWTYIHGQEARDYRLNVERLEQYA